ncbi:MAG: HD domain-containing protein [Tabrizicola flagellatus]|uniref:HD domain-containing protein n=1 Tax=Tabrizicola flagellatus TaxID=2593021 RepID=UPI00391CBC08
MLIDAAHRFAESAHAGQVRKGVAQEPYVTHLAEVANLTRTFGGSDEAIAAAWLHDTVEDCGVQPETLLREFGADVARIVAALTDDKSLPKAERKRLQVLHAPGKDADAALVKLCDKISNVASLAKSPPVHWDQARRSAYVDWAEAVVAGLPGLPPDGLSRFAATARVARMALAQG